MAEERTNGDKVRWVSSSRKHFGFSNQGIIIGLASSLLVSRQNSLKSGIMHHDLDLVEILSSGNRVLFCSNRAIWQNPIR